MVRSCWWILLFSSGIILGFLLLNVFLHWPLLLLSCGGCSRNLFLSWWVWDQGSLRVDANSSNILMFVLLSWMEVALLQGPWRCLVLFPYIKKMSTWINATWINKIMWIPFNPNFLPEISACSIFWLFYPVVKECKGWLVVVQAFNPSTAEAGVCKSLRSRPAYPTDCIPWQSGMNREIMYQSRETISWCVNSTSWSSWGLRIKFQYLKNRLQTLSKPSSTGSDTLAQAYTQENIN